MGTVFLVLIYFYFFSAFFYLRFEMSCCRGIVALSLLLCLAAKLVNAEGGNENDPEVMAAKLDDTMDGIVKTVKNNKESFQVLKTRLEKIIEGNTKNDGSALL